MEAASTLGRMAGTRRILFGLAGLALALCAGCATPPLTYSGFLQDYGTLARDADRIDQSSWRDPSVDFRNYRKVLIEPTVLYYSEKAKDKTLALEDKEKLEKEMSAMLATALGSRFQIVKEPSPDTLRVRVAITEIIPTLTGSARTGLDDRFPISLEDSHLEAEALDAMTAERKMALVDTRRGRGLPIVGNAVRWEGVRGALRQWAQDVADQLQTK